MEEVIDEEWEAAVTAYREFVDRVVKLSPGVIARTVMQGYGRSEPAYPEWKRRRSLLEALTPEQRDILLEMLLEARHGGIHDLLVLIYDRYRLVTEDGVELPVKPYYNKLYFDWLAREDEMTWEEIAGEEE